MATDKVSHVAIVATSPLPPPRRCKQSRAPPPDPRDSQTRFLSSLLFHSTIFSCWLKNIAALDSLYISLIVNLFDHPPHHWAKTSSFTEDHLQRIRSSFTSSSDIAATLPLSSRTRFLGLDSQASRTFSRKILSIRAVPRSAGTSNIFDISTDPLRRNLPAPNPPLREAIHESNVNYDTPPGCPWIST